jgi:hypothetical protein
MHTTTLNRTPTLGRFADALGDTVAELTANPAGPLARQVRDELLAASRGELVRHAQTVTVLVGALAPPLRHTLLKDDNPHQRLFARTVVATRCTR